MRDVIETERLWLRPFTIEDAEVAFTWFSDAAVMQFAFGPDRSVEDTRRRLGRYISHQDFHGFSKWMVLDKASGEAIGDAGLQVLDETGPAPDLGFRLASSFWGRGLATEVAAAWIRVAFERLGLTELSGFAHVDNAASLHVLDKVGFQRQARRAVMGLDAYTYLLRHQAQC